LKVALGGCCFFQSPGLSEVVGFPLELYILWIALPSFSSVDFRHEFLFDKLIQFIQVDLREDGANDTALRSSAPGLIILPLL